MYRMWTHVTHCNISLAMIKNVIKATILKRWNNLWKHSQKGRGLFQNIPIPTTTSLNIFKHPRHISSLIAQALTGHIPLRSYLSKFNIISSPHCHECDNTEETVQHIIFDCPIYTRKRLDLQIIISQHQHDWPLSLWELLQNEEALKVISKCCHLA